MKSILSRRHQLALTLTLFLGLPGASYGAAITVPQGLNPGDTYRIIFVTSTVTPPTSSNIDDYNMFVTNAANLDAGLAGLGTTWKALGATATVDVFTNTGLSALDTTTRFYNTAGQLVAVATGGSNTGLYGGFFTSHPNAIADETGAFSSRVAWTGVEPTGSSSWAPLGGSSDGLGLTLVGIADSTSYTWTYTGVGLSTDQYGLYGVSGVLTVPTPGAPLATPEPSTIALLGGALVALAVAKGRGARK